MSVSRKTLMGLAFESPAGTKATAPAVWVPAKSILKGTKKKEHPDEERGNLDEIYDSILVEQGGAMDPKGAYYNDVHPYFIKGVIGGFTNTQPDVSHAPTVYKHAFAWADVPPSMTLFKSYDGNIRYAGYGVCEKLGFKFSADKLLECDPTLKCNYPVDFGGSWTPTVSTLKAMAGYSPTIVLDSVTSHDVNEFQLDIELAVRYWHASDGNPDYITAYFDGRKATLSFTARMDDPVPVRQRFDQGLKSTMTVKFKGPLIVNSGPSGTPPNQDYFQELFFSIANFDYESAEEDEGKGNITIKVKGTVESPSTNLTGYVQNTIATY